MLNAGTQCGGKNISAVRRAAAFAPRAALVVGAALFLPAVFSCASSAPADGGAETEAAQERDGSILTKEIDSRGRGGPDNSAWLLGQDGAEFWEDIFLPERFQELPRGQSAVTVKTSKSKAALYVNGEYHGLTPLMATGLVPGRYYVQIKKRGFKDVNIAIQVKDGVSDFYYIEMQADDSSSAKNDSAEAAPKSAEDGSVIQTQRQEAPEP